jgi:hypothetical protein
MGLRKRIKNGEIVKTANLQKRYVAGNAFAAPNCVQFSDLDAISFAHAYTRSLGPSTTDTASEWPLTPKYCKEPLQVLTAVSVDGMSDVSNEILPSSSGSKRPTNKQKGVNQ